MAKETMLQSIPEENEMLKLYITRSFSNDFVLAQDCTLSELLAIKLGLTCAWNRGFWHVICKTDSLEAILLINLEVRPNSHSSRTLLAEINLLLVKDWHVSIAHVFRATNSAADLMTAIGFANKVGLEVWLDPPARVLPRVSSVSYQKEKIIELGGLSHEIGLQVMEGVERLSDLLIEKARFLYGVSGQVKNLQAELKRMQCFLRDAERRQSESESIKNLIYDIRKLAYDAEDVIEIYATKVACGMNFGTKNPFYKNKHLHNVESEITSINSQISDLARNLQNYGLIASTDNEESRFTFEAQRELRWSYSHIVEEFIVGLDEDINKVVE
ncbi:Virus X resistance protein-like, coiled-coil domain [Sesbania bispinosa]|nr:Virus X resistance protein-like, coiled-coil domain [Sesbania bispinosa]